MKTILPLLALALAACALAQTPTNQEILIDLESQAARLREGNARLEAATRALQANDPQVQQITQDLKTLQAELEYQPAYWVAAGAGWNHYATPQASGWLNFAARFTDKNYSFTTIDMTAVQAGLRTGIARILIEQDGFGLLAIGEAGIATGGGQLGAAVAGGGAMTYDISRWTKIPHTYAVGTVRVLKTTLGEVQPVFGFGIAKAF